MPQEEIKTPHGSIWQEAVPLPLYTHMRWNIFRPAYQCECGIKFRLEGDYQHHYRKVHISEP